MSSPPATHFAVTHTDEEWRTLLTAAQYSVLREAGTEQPYSSPLNNEHRHGVFGCAGCAQPLYSSDTKFESGTGWPSFWKALDDAVLERPDTNLSYSHPWAASPAFIIPRYVFGVSPLTPGWGSVLIRPQPAGLRYCMNGIAMTFTTT